MNEKIDHLRELKRIKRYQSNEWMYICIDSNDNEYVLSQEQWNVAFEPFEYTNSCLVTNQSKPQEKINLFRSLFVGRNDVYAKRFMNMKSGQSGYVPACRNEWITGLCDKKNFSCIKCVNRDFYELSDEVIYKHLEGKDEHGRDTIGTYPLLDNDLTKFLAMDFDGSNWISDLKTVKDVCSEFGIPCAIERSRSGNGGHLWIFFKDPISAMKAREIGTGILFSSMEKRHEIEFSSFDRLFPNQDKIPIGGLGNLIALPLQGRPRKLGNSVFLDLDFEPYQDQWSYLSNLEKIALDQVNELLRVLPKDSDTSDSNDIESLNYDETLFDLSSQDFGDHAKIRLSNGILICKKSLSQKALFSIKKMGAFKNPEFFKAQAMRLATFNKPRVIDTSIETKDDLCIPRGCLEDLVHLLTRQKIPFTIEDQRTIGNELNTTFLAQLSQEQEIAATKMLENDTGVLSATTGFGKTVVASFMISQRKTNTLVLVHTVALLEQWKNSLNKFLRFDDSSKTLGSKAKSDNVGQLGSGKNNLTKNIDIALMQSMFDGDDVKEYIKDYGMIIVDECHHVPSYRFEKILYSAQAKYVYGLTATPIRQDGHQPIIFMQCGPIRYKTTIKDRNLASSMSHFVLPQFTSTRLPNQDELSIQDAYQRLVKDDVRNAQIVEEIKKTIDLSRSPLVLTERVDHAEELYRLLNGTTENVFLLTGRNTMKVKKERLHDLSKIPEDKSVVIIATGKYIGEGFDFPRLDTLFLALPIAWKGTLSQYSGRIHREYLGKNEVLIYDFVDIHINVFSKMYQKRQKGYNELGYQVKLRQEDTNICRIYSSNDYFSIYLEDFKNLKEEVVVITPRLNKSKVKELIRVFISNDISCKKITVVTKPRSDYQDADTDLIQSIFDELKFFGIKVIEISGLSYSMTIFDKTVSWYGDMNSLSFNLSESNILRIEDKAVASEFKTILDDLIIDKGT